jgi:hypothetical protein
MVDKKRGKKKMKSKQELEKERLQGKSFDELIAEIDFISKKTASIYIPELFEASRREHPDWTKRQHETRIQDAVKNHWSYQTVLYHEPQDWKNQERVESGKKGKLAQIAQANKEKEDSIRQTELDLMRYAIKTMEDVEQQYEEEGTSTAVPVPEEEKLATGKEFGPTPLELYERSLRGFEKSWMALTGEDHLIASAADDLTQHHIAPTRKVRVKLVKGLDEQRRLHLRNCATYMIAVLEDVVKIDTDTARREQ